MVMRNEGGTKEAQSPGRAWNDAAVPLAQFTGSSQAQPDSVEPRTSVTISSSELRRNGKRARELFFRFTHHEKLVGLHSYRLVQAPNGLDRCGLQSLSSAGPKGALPKLNRARAGGQSAREPGLVTRSDPAVPARLER